jgi:phytoene synthase
MNAHDSPEAVFRKNSRSFSLAASFFAARDRSAVARMYCFCRFLDDLADDTQTGDHMALDLAHARLVGKCEAPGRSVEADFLALARERSFPLDPALDLIAALRVDCGSRSIQTTDELIRFAYGVAGTVGRMLRHVIDARDARADAFAIDLGIGLQLSNVIRDIAEDARRGRFYLPAEWVEPEEVLRAMAGDASAISRVDQAVQCALDLSERYYESARSGFAFIPQRNRRVIFIAAALYQEIGRKVSRSGPGGWRQRTVVRPGEKLGVIIRSLRECRRWRTTKWSEHPEPQHDSTLHDALFEVLENR